MGKCRNRAIRPEHKLFFEKICDRPSRRAAKFAIRRASAPQVSNRNQAVAETCCVCLAADAKGRLPHELAAVKLPASRPAPSRNPDALMTDLNRRTLVKCSSCRPPSPRASTFAARRSRRPRRRRRRQVRFRRCRAPRARSRHRAFRSRRTAAARRAEQARFRRLARHQVPARKGLSRRQRQPFRLQLFHLGHLFKRPVTINTIRDGIPTPIPYTASLFDYGHTKLGQAAAGQSRLRRLSPALSAQLAEGVRRGDRLSRRQLFPLSRPRPALRHVGAGAGDRRRHRRRRSFRSSANSGSTRQSPTPTGRRSMACSTANRPPAPIGSTSIPASRPRSKFRRRCSRARPTSNSASRR